MNAPFEFITGSTDAPLRDEAGSGVEAFPDETPTASLQPWSARVTAVAATCADLASGTVLCSRYVLEEVIGRGGISVVFRARDLHRALPQEAPAASVAIKVLRPEQRANPWAIACLQREFRQMQRLSHPGIARVYDLDCDGDAWFISMELIAGRDVRAWIGTPGGPGAALRLIGECCAALEHAHSRGILHGDLKPTNVMVAQDGGARLIDFGSSPEPAGAPPLGALTVAGATASYASPQILMGRNAEGRDDVYSLACLSYAMLSGGRHPFGGRPSFEDGRVKMAPTVVRTIATELFAVIERGLSAERERRQASVREFRLQLIGAAQCARASIAAAGTTRSVAAAEPGTIRRSPELAALVPRVGRFDRAARHAWHRRPVLRRIALGTVVAGLAGLLRYEASGVDRLVTALSRRDATVAAATVAVEPSQRLPTLVGGPPVYDAGVVSFGSPAIHASSAQSLIAIAVRRHGGRMSAGSFRWRVEPGSAHPVIDDARAGPRLVRFIEGQSVRSLFIPLINVPATALPAAHRSFTVVLERVAGGPALGWPARITVAIEPWSGAGPRADYQVRARK